jgi:hypothetical protein
MPVSITAKDSARPGRRLAGHPQRQTTDLGELDRVVQQAFQALRQFVLAMQAVRQLGATSTLKSSDLLALAVELHAQGLDHPRRLNVGVALSLPACNSVRVRMPLTMRIMSRAEPAAVCWYCSSSGSSSTVCISSSEPITPFIGRAQFVGQGGEEFVLELVAVGQLLVEHFEFLPGVEQGLRLLLAHRVDAVGQRQDSSATSMAEPIWLAYMVRNTFGSSPAPSAC